MHAVNHFWIITFFCMAINLLNHYSEYWDEHTRAMYGIYIITLQSTSIPFNLYNLYTLYCLFRREKPRAVPVDVSGEPGLTVRNSQFDPPLEFGRGIYNVGHLFGVLHWYSPYWHHKKHQDRLFLGTREVISREVETSLDGTSFEKLHLGSYKWLTYKQVHEAITRFAGGMLRLKIRKDERAAIFSESRAEFLIAMHGCFSRGVVAVILDVTLGQDALCQSLNENEVTTMICGCKELKKLANIHGQLESVKRVICMDDDIPFDDSSALHGWTIISMTDVKKLGKRQWGPFHWSKQEEVAVIMYTSGSTRSPKGVMMTHANILATILAVMTIIPNLDTNDVYLAYLPMTHIHEFIVEHVIGVVGGAIGYGTPLADRVKKGTKGDATMLMPTLMATAPTILDRVRDAILKKVNAEGGISKKLFDFAYERRLQAFNGSWFGAWALEKVLWNLLVFRKVREIMGGHMRFIISTGAPLSPDTHRFVNICLSATILQGYGLAETCAGGTFSDYDDSSVGRVGLPLPCTYVKLIDWPGGGYSTNDSLMPSGEIVIGGTSVTLGYFKNEERTRASYKVDENGVRWFYTGDIGRFHADGCLEIIGQKEDILKLQH